MILKRGEWEEEGEILLVEKWVALVPLAALLTGGQIVIAIQTGYSFLLDFPVMKITVAHSFSLGRVPLSHPNKIEYTNWNENERKIASPPHTNRRYQPSLFPYVPLPDLN